MSKSENCPVCGSSKYRYISYQEEGWGIVEQHGNCDRCGYMIEQAYSNPIVGFKFAQTKGRKLKGVYYPKNSRHMKRMRRKYGIRHNSTDWVLNLI